MHSIPRTWPVSLIFILGLLPGGCSPRVEDKSQGSPAPKEGKVMTTSKITATIVTSMGTLEAELYPDDAPLTVENFAGLAEQKYYDGVTFHRIAKRFVIQGGDPSGTGTGGKTLTGKPLEDELNPAAPSFKSGYLKGVLAMANKGRPATGTSQFFIMLADNMSLPKQYTIFGRVVKGLEVVDAIGGVDITPGMGPTDGKPKVPVVIKMVTIRREPAEEKK